MEQRSRTARESSMISGVIWKSLVAFAIPLLLSSLFQQLYNVADSLIVGNFLGDGALAAVSSSGSLINLLVDFFNGLFTGAGILVANTYGSGDEKKLSAAVHTTVAFGLITGIFLTALGTLSAPLLLSWMDTPASILADSTAYFRVYFSGSLAFVMYNCCTGILRNIGDSVRPLWYLLAASGTNVVLDLVFVGAFRWGIASAALATILSQGLSAALCLRHLCRVRAAYRVDLRSVRPERQSLRLTLHYGLPSGFQNSVIAFSNALIQASVNAFDVKAIAGCGVCAKLEGFAILPILSFSMALSTFAGQNKGAGKPERVKEGSLFGVLCCCAFAGVTGVVLLLAMPALTALFNRDAGVIAFSVQRARITAPFFVLLGFSNCMGGILRGIGKVRTSMVIYLICWCLIRVAFILAGVRIFPDIRIIFWAYPITWLLSTLAFAWTGWREVFSLGREAGR